MLLVAALPKATGMVNKGHPHLGTGPSTSGKSADFDSAIPRFESWRANQFAIYSSRLWTLTNS